MKPDVYLFNPTCELAVANGSTNYMAPGKLRRFEDELSTLPGFLASPTDLVLVNQVPGPQFTDRLEMAGFNHPVFFSRELLLADPEFSACAKGFLYPWGWSPAMHKVLASIKPGCCPEFLNSPVAEWREIHRDLYNRKSALNLLKNITKQQISDQWLSWNDFPEICTSHEQIIALQQKWGKVVVKAPLSSSGRGLQVLRPGEYNQTNRQVISGVLKQQEFVITGPWHKKVLDLSFQFFSFGDGKVEYRGLTTFSTDHLGRYSGTYLQELPPDMEQELKEFIQQHIPAAFKVLEQALISSDYSTSYYGWLGVDALIWRSDDGVLKFHPCLEINCRFTMGAIALSLRTHLAEQSAGEFRIMHGKEGQFNRFCDEMVKNEPLIMEGGKIVSGFLPVTPDPPNVLSGAWISVKVNESMKIRGIFRSNFIPPLLPISLSYLQTNYY